MKEFLNNSCLKFSLIEHSDFSFFLEETFEAEQTNERFHSMKSVSEELDEEI